MSYDSKTRTIYVDENSDFMKDSGVHFVYQLRDDAQREITSVAIQQYWKIISKWLSCSVDTFNELHNEKIAKGWKAYLAN